MRASLILLVLLLLLCYVLAALTYLKPAPKPLPRGPVYDVKAFCKDHPDVCSRGRLAVHATATP
jgi:hypothetical protein